MERSILNNELSKEGIIARLSSKKVKPLVFGNFFGLKQVTSLTWESLSGESGVPVMADIVSYDSAAPLKTREVIKKAKGDIPKISVSRTLNESGLDKYNDLKRVAGSDTGKKELINFVYDDAGFVYDAVRAKMEFSAFQALSTGAFKLVASNNNGLVTEADVDLGIPADNKAGVSINWSDKATSKPVEDIQALVDVAEGKGDTVQYIVMKKAQWVQFKNSADVISKVKSWINTTKKVTITKSTIDEYMLDNELPKIVVINPKVKFENNETHAKTVVDCWADNRVALIVDQKVGDIQHKPLAIESSDTFQKTATAAKKDFVYVYKYSELNPYNEFTIGEANAMPVLNDVTSIYLLRTDNTTWAD